MCYLPYAGSADTCIGTFVVAVKKCVFLIRSLLINKSYLRCYFLNILYCKAIICSWHTFFTVSISYLLSTLFDNCSNNLTISG